jgi:hypothetical protein
MAGRNLNSVFQVQNKKTIDILLSEIRSNGVVKTNQFEVHINFPQSFDTRRDRSITLRAQSVFMPGTNLSTVTDNNIYGPDRNIVSGVTYANEVVVTFLLDSQMKIRTYFEDWQKLTYDETSWNVKYYDDYVGTVDIFNLSNKLGTSNAFKSSGFLESAFLQIYSALGNPKDIPDYGLRCWQAYPINIGQVEFSSTDANTLGTIDIGFSFRYTTNIDRMGSSEPFNFSSRKTSSLDDSPPNTSSLDDSPPNNVKPSAFKSDSVNGVPTTFSSDAGDMSGARTSGEKSPASTRIGAGQSLAGIPESMDFDGNNNMGGGNRDGMSGETTFNSDFSSPDNIRDNAAAARAKTAAATGRSGEAKEAAEVGRQQLRIHSGDPTPKQRIDDQAGGLRSGAPPISKSVGSSGFKVGKETAITSGERGGRGVSD